MHCIHTHTQSLKNDYKSGTQLRIRLRIEDAPMCPTQTISSTPPQK